MPIENPPRFIPADELWCFQMQIDMLREKIERLEWICKDTSEKVNENAFMIFDFISKFSNVLERK